MSGRTRAAAARASGRKAGLALLYHRIEPRSGDPTTEFSPPVSCSAFADQLEHVSRRYRMVRAGELPEAVRRRRRGERLPVAITFDDDLPTHRRWALEGLQRAGLTGTFFLN